MLGFSPYCSSQESGSTVVIGVHGNRDGRREPQNSSLGVVDEIQLAVASTPNELSCRGARAAELRRVLDQSGRRASPVAGSTVSASDQTRPLTKSAKK